VIVLFECISHQEVASQCENTRENYFFITKWYKIFDWEMFLLTWRERRTLTLTMKCLPWCWGKKELWHWLWWM